MTSRALMVSCHQRDQVRALTLASWKETDWGSDVTVELDHGTHPDVFARMEETWLRVLRTAADDDAEISLLLEDDLIFNRFLRHNLERWPPLVAAAAGPRGRPFYGSLYRVDQPIRWRNDRERYMLAAPERAWGSQAIVISRVTARHLLRRWVPGEKPHDVQMSALAAEIGRIHYHLPSLVQHRLVPSTWGAGPHQARDFDAEFKVETIANGFGAR